MHCALLLDVPFLQYPQAFAERLWGRGGVGGCKCGEGPKGDMLGDNYDI